MKNPKRSGVIIMNWLKTRSAIEYLGLWETLNNDNFKVIFSETVDPIVSDSYYMTAERKSDIEAQMKLHNLSKAGEYEITYKVIDESGNEVLFTRTVIVKDNSNIIWLVVGLITLLVGSIGFVLLKKKKII